MAPSPTSYAMTEPTLNPWRVQAQELTENLERVEREAETLRAQLVEAESRAAQWEQPALFGDVLNLTEWKETDS